MFSSLGETSNFQVSLFECCASCIAVMEKKEEAFVHRREIQSLPNTTSQVLNTAVSPNMQSQPLLFLASSNILHIMQALLCPAGANLRLKPSLT